MRDSSHAGGSINKIQVLIGLVSLIVGTMVYFLDRPPEETYFINRFGFLTRFHNIVGDLVPGSFGAVAGWLPEFVHIFSFILLTAGIVSRGKGWNIIVCSLWLFIDLVFELGQRFSAFSLRLVPDWFSDVPILESARGYFSKGTFDVKDVIAVMAGAVAAYIVLVITTPGNGLMKQSSG